MGYAPDWGLLVVRCHLEKRGSQMFKSIALIIALAIFPAANAQDANPQPRQGIVVTSVKLGSHINSDLTVPVPKNIFKPIETIHLSVATNASGDIPINGSIGVLWTYGEGTDLQAVQDDSRELEFQGDGITVFEISKPDPWPEGQYHAEVFLDGKSVQKVGFTVR
jgi:hypothetical protein